MENNYKSIDIGYEFWNRGYMFRSSISGERWAYRLYIALYEAGTIKSVDEFLTWVLNTNSDMIFNYREEDERYRKENEPKIREFFAKHIEGKTWPEIDPETWSFYSDWHKDVFGYRPRNIECGEYFVNPPR